MAFLIKIKNLNLTLGKEKDLEKNYEKIKISNQQNLKDLIEEIKEKISILRCLINDHQNEVKKCLKIF